MNIITPEIASHLATGKNTRAQSQAPLPNSVSEAAECDRHFCLCEPLGLPDEQQSQFTLLSQSLSLSRSLTLSPPTNTPPTTFSALALFSHTCVYGATDVPVLCDVFELSCEGL